MDCFVATIPHGNPILDRDAKTPGMGPLPPFGPSAEMRDGGRASRCGGDRAGIFAGEGD